MSSPAQTISSLTSTTPALVQSVQQRWSRLPEFLQGAGYAAAIVVLCGVSVDAAVFIYFQF